MAAVGSPELLIVMGAQASGEQVDEVVARLEEAGASATGDILEGPDITFTASDEASAVARVAQTTTVDGTEREVGFTVRLTLVKVGEDWKADAFELLGGL